MSADLVLATLNVAETAVFYPSDRSLRAKCCKKYNISSRLRGDLRKMLYKMQHFARKAAYPPQKSCSFYNISDGGTDGETDGGTGGGTDGGTSGGTTGGTTGGTPEEWSEKPVRETDRRNDRSADQRKRRSNGQRNDRRNRRRNRRRNARGTPEVRQRYGRRNRAKNPQSLPKALRVLIISGPPRSRHLDRVP